MFWLSVISFLLRGLRRRYKTGNAYKMRVNCTSEGTNCRNDGIRHAQLLDIPFTVMRLVPIVIAAAVRDPMKYDELKSAVKNGRSFGYPNSPSIADPEIMQNGIPKPSIIRDTIYIGTAGYQEKSNFGVRRRSRTYSSQQGPAE